MSNITASVTLCKDCVYVEVSKTVEYAYTCKNNLSPCRNRTVVYGDFCRYGVSKEDIVSLDEIKSLPF